MSLKPQDVGRPRLSPKDPWFPAERPPGAFPPSPRSDTSAPCEVFQTVSAAVHARRNEFIHKKNVKVKVGTWNVAAMSGTQKDLGGWFAHGLGVKGLAQNLSRTSLNTTSSSDEGSEEEDEVIESVHDQESRHQKKSTTLPENDSAAVCSGEEIGLYVLGLQEVIDISSMTESIRPYTDPNPAKKWKQALRKALPRGYKKVAEQQLLGLLLLIFAAPDIAPQVSNVDATSVGTGLLGYLGNKGAVSARIVLGEATRLLFVNCHLAAGADEAALTRRIWDTNQVLTRTKFTPTVVDGETGKTEYIGDEDFAFWFGDLNYRLDGIPGDDVRRLLLLHARNEYDISNKSRRKIDSELGYMNVSADLAPPSQFEIDDGDAETSAIHSSAEPPMDPNSDPASLLTTIKSLLAHDQLHAQQRLRKAFYDGWREGEINFLPTYKYDIGSVAMFDSGEKKRSPSWCDRILFRTRRDKELYDERVKIEAQAKQKDEEMHKRGLDTEAAQEDILFDYDPNTDGANYDEDADELEDDIHDVELIQTRDLVDDPIEVEDYISHQRVLSSDHKPLTAVFSLTYDAVIPELKAKVHQEVAREFDKAENEGRPNVTVVLDLPFGPSSSSADKSSDTTELKIVEFGEVRFRFPKHRHLTIANTGQIEAMVAFVERPGDEIIGKIGPTPEWLEYHVDLEVDSTKDGPEDLRSATRYKLLPGDTTNVELKLDVKDIELVRKLNTGEIALDDVLVLRVSNGRDHFIPIKGTWLQTCFGRSLDELVRIPSGVRSLTLRQGNMEAQQKPAGAVHHSAPQELFALTDAIPSLVERVAAEWDMLHTGEDPPWKQRGEHSWPFRSQQAWHDEHQEKRQEQLAAIREALDTATPIDQHLDVKLPSLLRLELLAETLVEFLASLSDGILTATIWNEVDSKLTNLEKSKSLPDTDAVQEIVMEAFSSAPIHSVSFTFVIFMLTRVITELCASVADTATSPKVSTRSRSSTNASEALSEVSLSSEPSNFTKRSFLPSLIRRATPEGLVTHSNTTGPLDTRKDLVGSYAEVFAPLIIRSEGDRKMTRKEKKVLEGRKRKVLEAFLEIRP